VEQDVREYKEVLYIEYIPIENSFYDEGGFHIDNILDIITPNDLLLFRNDYDFKYFTHRFNKDVLCIISVSDEYIYACRERKLLW